jgi:hypothetical protein
VRVAQSRAEKGAAKEQSAISNQAKQKAPLAQHLFKSVLIGMNQW